jgi:hypothetical protein
VGGGGRAEDVGAVADAADHGLVGRGELGAERRAEPPAETAGRRRREVAARRPELGLIRVEIVLVDEDRPVIHEVPDAPREPRHVDGCVRRDGTRAGGASLALAGVLARPVLAPLRDRAAVGQTRRGLGQRRHGEPRGAGEGHVGGEAADRVAREERVHPELDDLRVGMRGSKVRIPGRVRFDDEDEVGLVEPGRGVETCVERMILGEVQMRVGLVEDGERQRLGERDQRRHRRGISTERLGDDDGVARGQEPRGLRDRVRIGDGRSASAREVIGVLKVSAGRRGSRAAASGTPAPAARCLQSRARDPLRSRPARRASARSPTS